MSVRRTAVWLTASMALAAFAPVAAEANHQTGWQDGGAAVPATVDLAEVAAFGGSGVVVAVGTDATTGNARIFRRVVAGTWVEDTITLPGALSSSLVEVDVSQDAAWAVGTFVDGTGTHPLSLRVGGGAAALTTAVPTTWTQSAEALPSGTVPTAIALRATDGLIGTAAGTVLPFHDASGGSIDDPVASPQPAGAINAITLYDTGKGFTAGELQPGGGTARVHQVDLSAVPDAARMLPVTMVPGSGDPNLPLAGIGSDSTTDAVAVEANPNGNQDPGTWAPSGGAWTRDGGSGTFTQNSKPSDLSLRKVSDVLQGAVAGTHGGAGAVWRRSGTGSWLKANPTPGGEALNGVALIAADDIWAVGDDGEVVHYAPLPDAAAPNTFIDSGPSATTNDPMATFTFSSDTGTSFECSVDGAPFTSCTSPKTVGPLSLDTHTFEVKASGPTGTDLTAASRTVTVVAPDTTIDIGPSGTTSDTTPTFGFFSDLASADFECSVDGAAFTDCNSPKTLGELPEGPHSFQVRAVSSAGADPSPASRSFTVDVPDAPCVDVPRPLVRDVVVRKLGGSLKIEFVVAALARVRAKAFHGDKLIGRTKEKVFKPGARTLRLRWKGDLKPTRLKISARPAAANACT